MYEKPDFRPILASLREPGLTRDWLAAIEGSNSHITDCVSAFESFEEFRLFLAGLRRWRLREISQ